MTDYLTTAQIAERYNVSASTVQRWLRDGRITGIKINAQQWLIPREAIDGFVKPTRGRKPTANEESTHE